MQTIKIHVHNRGIRARSLIAALWAAVALNILGADVLMLYLPGALIAPQAFVVGSDLELIMLAGAILIEVAIAMVPLSFVLRGGWDRWLHTGAASVTFAFVVGSGSMTPHYMFFASAEILCLTVIVLVAWLWSGVGGHVLHKKNRIPRDVQRFIDMEFPAEHRNEARTVLQNAKLENGLPPGEHQLRCAVFASNGSLEWLKRNSMYLTEDWRDVVVAAECEWKHGTLTQVRDLTKRMPVV